MSRRTHTCLGCEQRTRHDDQICAACRRKGIFVEGNSVHVPLVMRPINYRGRGA